MMGWLAPLRHRCAKVAAFTGRSTGATHRCRLQQSAEKPAFRSAFAKQRALIPADGFYEWQKQGAGKQPYHIDRRDHAPFAFASLWERWHDRAHEHIVETFTIVTTSPNALLSPIHDRMPVILAPKDFERWLMAEEPPTDLLRPYPGDDLEAVPVSTWVNSPAHDDARCVEPLADARAASVAAEKAVKVVRSEETC